VAVRGDPPGRDWRSVRITPRASWGKAEPRAHFGAADPKVHFGKVAPRIRFTVTDVRRGHGHLVVKGRR
jgi:hypothetical protein